MNHLHDEKSPYLLQHAENAVDWYPWCQEAFERAVREDKPVFLSIGYSTCHWCHVMAHESFEDPEVGARMNQVFISVKVDREERPDVDAVYMEACQAMNGSGGWPLNVILTPEKKPFFAATYLPKNNRYGQWGLMELTDEIQRLWNDERERIEEAGEQLTRWIRAGEEDGASSGNDDQAVPGQEYLRHAVEELRRSYDPVWGGFGKAPKFPMGHTLLFLLRFADREEAMQKAGGTPSDMESTAYGEAAEMALHTLERMYRGGIYDHLGGGFSRYSTDERWLVPHFEKMLYDNCLLAMAYAEAWKRTGEELYRRVAERTLDYMLRELRLEGGGFACGQDADSDGEEGKFYVFTEEEICSVLGEKRGPSFCRLYGVSRRGNFEGKNVLNRLNYEGEPDSVTAWALDQEDRRLLYEYRAGRCSLHRDDKVLASWNGMALAAFSLAYGATGQGKYLQAARELARFLKEHMTDRRGRLFLRWKDGEGAIDGQLSDYSFCAWGLLELYEVTAAAEYLEEASRLMELACELFMDEERGGFFMYSQEAEQLISRPKEAYDGAMPSGNSIVALVLNRLAQLTGKTEWIQRAQRQNQWITERGSGLMALVEALYPSWQLICVQAGESASDEQSLWELRRELRRRDENGVILVKNGENELALARVSPMTVNYPIPEEGVRYYYCRDGVCRAPVTTEEELLELMGRKEQ